jgi:propionyl-CoA carboxylase alpha chain
MKVGGKDEILQFDKVEDDGIRYTFNLKGNSVKISVYNEAQFKYKHFMPVPATIDYAKSIISPMPGAIVQVFVQPGDHVVAGQQLCIIEAMKMQNVIKAEIEGEIAQVNVDAGASVAVDELLIQFK